MDTATWIQLVQVLVGIAAIIVAVVTVKQKQAADGRTAWWSRLQWTLDRIISEDRIGEVTGLRLLPVITQSSLSSEDDRRLAETVDALVESLSDIRTPSTAVDSVSALKEDEDL
ncbi:hypothetical protein ACT3SZ_09715 [Corynebacterium sp. AOP40-9SA-29]|uniref:hypothetical protein n=1 Tax=Corynebacterium sp. AOP40-9SA-29 TaxID=3457677 RepID=UPI0040339052